MPNPYFKFKQFTIWHDRCAMKVGTDGVILGALASHPDPKKILDIGTGTGLVALMLAQRFPTACITGIEIDLESFEQAADNVKESPFATRITVHHTSLQEYIPERHFDLIVCNPPFFKVSSQSESAARNTARQTGSLHPADIFEFASKYLDPKGKLVLIFPSESDLGISAHDYGLFAEQQLRIKGNQQAPEKRIVWTFGFETPTLSAQELILEESRNVYTNEFKALIKDFYLNL